MNSYMENKYSGTTIIMRGLPGSSKSFLANMIDDSCRWREESCTICCADDYMMEAGEYKWSPDKVGPAHQYCRNKFADALNNSIGTIIVSNTNTTMKEMKFYIDLAKEKNYYVQILTVGEFSDEAIDRYAIQNQHNVPRETLVKMRDRFKLL